MLKLLSHRVKEELGPLCPDWFELLTSKASKEAREEQYHGVCEHSCVQDDGFKTPQAKPAAGSQYSTPKILRGQGIQSSVTTSPDQELHPGQKESESLHWLDTTPGGFGFVTDSHDVSSDLNSSRLSRECFGDFIGTPKSTLHLSTKRISESLGAQMDPDVSWTSSLNTPPVLSPTVILPKTADTSYPVSSSADKKVVFVRRLFPSLSEKCGVPEPSSENHQVAEQCEDPISRLENDGCVGGVPPHVAASSQKHELPGDSQHEAVQTKAASVLDRDEHVFSIFYSHGSSASWPNENAGETRSGKDTLTETPTRVGEMASPTDMTHEVYKAPQVILTHEVHFLRDCPTPAASYHVAQRTPVTSPLCSERDTNARMDSVGQNLRGRHLPETLLECRDGNVEERKLDQCDSILFGCKSIENSEEKNKVKNLGAPNIGIKAPKSGCEDSFTTDTLQPNVKVPEFHSAPVGGATGEISVGTNSSHKKEVADSQPCGSQSPKVIKKPTRKFVYSLQSPLTHTIQSSRVNDNSVSSSSSFSERPTNDGIHDRNSIQKTNSVSMGTCFPTSGQMDGNRLTDAAFLTLKPNGRNELSSNQLDDFTKSGIGQKTSTVVKKSTQSTEPSDCSGYFSNTVKTMWNRGPDDGCGPVGINIQNDKGDQLESGFKTASEKIISLSAEAIQKAKLLLDEEPDSSMTGGVTGNKKCSVNSFAYAEIQSKVLDTVSNSRSSQITNKCPRSVNIRTRQLSKSSVNTPDTDGTFLTLRSPQSSTSSLISFKTASNKAIHVSPINLKKGRKLLEEVTAEESCPPVRDIPACKDEHKEETSMQKNSARLADGPQSPAKSQSQGHLEDCSSLTASQKADVTELCSLLEEADTQFEFTQFKQASVDFGALDAVSSPPHSSKEMDSDLLTGIDFDDSFNSPGDMQINTKQSGDIMEPDGLAPNSDLGHSGLQHRSKTVDIPSCSLYGAVDKSTNDSLHLEDADASIVPGHKVSSDNFRGFYTGQGVQITVSVENLKRASSVFDGLELDSDLNSFSRNNSGYPKEMPGQLQNRGMKKTTEGSKGVVSYGSSEQKKGSKQETEGSTGKDQPNASLLEYNCIDDGRKRQHCSIKESSNTGTPQSFVGFKTARGTAVNISEGSMRKAAAIFADLEEDRRNIKECGQPSHTDTRERNDAEGMERDVLQSCGNFNPRSSESHADCGLGDKLDCPGKKITNISKATVTLMSDYSMKSTGADVANQCISKEACLEPGKPTLNRVVLAQVDANETSVSLKPNCETTVKASVLTPSNHGLNDADGMQSEKDFQPINIHQEKPFAEPLAYGKSVEEIKADLSCDLLGEGGGFRTASGKGVSISVKALQRARDIFTDCSDTSGCEIRVDGKGSKSSDAEDGLLGFHYGKGMSASSNAQLEEKAITCSRPDEEIKRSMRPVRGSAGTVCLGFSVADGIRKPVSETALMNDTQSEEKPFDRFYTLKPMENLGDGPHGSICGFSTASGKGVKVTTKALQEAKALFSDMEIIPFFESGTEAVENEKPKSGRCLNDATEMSCAFSTAGGQKVCVSRKSLMKARALLDQCNDRERMDGEKCAEGDKSTRNLLEHQSTEQVTDDGKGMSFSTEAHYSHTKGVSSCDYGSEEASEVERQKSNSLLSEVGKMNSGFSGFSTAGGKKVSVSRKSLIKAKAFLGQCDDIVEMESDKCGGVKCTPPLEKKSTGDYRLAEHSTRINKEETFSGQTVCNANSVFTMCQDGKICAEQRHVNVQSSTAVSDSSSSQQTAGMLERHAKIKQDVGPNLESDPSHEHSTVHKEAPEMCQKVPTALGAVPKPCSSLSLQHLELNGCTDTQQQYLEQEAMACTRALLEDEEENGSGIPRGSLESPLSARPALQSKERYSEEGKTRSRKRSRVADCSLKADQPPLKRQLLADFDRTSNDRKNPLLTPLTCSPNGTLKDRPMFKYSMALQPNVTRPFSENTLLAQRLKTDSGSPHRSSCHENSRASFPPPFRKPPAPQGGKETVSRGKSRTPHVFVPPFKSAHRKSSNGVGVSSSHSQNSRKSPCQSRSAADQNVYISPANCRSDPTPPPKTIPEHIFNSKGATHCSESNSSSGGDVDAKSKEKGLDKETLSSTLASSLGDTSVGSDAGLMTLENLKHARDLQDMRIMKKRRQTIRPQPGSLYLAKSSGRTRLSLRRASGGRCPVRLSQDKLYKLGVHRGVSEITSENAESFRFHLRDFFKRDVLTAGSGVQLADGGWLVPNTKGSVGKEEFYRALCDTPGVDPKLITESWVHNHYRWVVWKRASMEKSFPELMGSQALSPQQVLLQLKYRYDVEIDRSQRSALRKIMERDETAAKTMVLCVCGVVSMGPGRSKTAQNADGKVDGDARLIWVTDGWYAIKALLDAPLTAQLQKGRLAVGTKILTHGAELVGSQDACTPLEAPSTLMLKISANSTRRARWDTRLGLYPDPRPLQLRLSSLFSSGGLVGCIDVVVLRSYPLQWMERKPGGVYVFRNSRAEEKEALRHSDGKQKAMEALFAKVQEQFEKDQEARKPSGRGKKLSHQEIEGLQEGQELLEAVEGDPSVLESLLSRRQLDMLYRYRQTLEQERQAEIQQRFRHALEEAQESKGMCCDRDVSPVWKLCVADWREPQEGSGYLLNIWRPTVDLQTLLKEGNRYKIYHLSTSEGKKRYKNAAVQLTATRKTRFQQVQTSPDRLSGLFLPRVSVSFSSLLNLGFRPFCGEVDIVGCVVCIGDTRGAFPVVHLADAQLDCVAVTFSCSLAQLALEDVVKPRALLALTNLQVCHRTSSAWPVLYAGDLAAVSTNPKELHLQQALARIRSAVQDREDFFRIAEEKLFAKTRTGISSLPSAKEGGTTPKTPTSTIPQLRVNKETGTSPVGVGQTSGVQTPVHSKETPTAGSSADRDPRSLKRKRGLDYLSRIPSPPPLHPLGSTASPTVSRTFHPPRRSATPRSMGRQETPVVRRVPLLVKGEEEWVKDEELAMINTQALLDGLGVQGDTGAAD